MATTQARAILSAGLVSLNLYNEQTQSWSGFADAIDADKFEIKPEFEEKVSESRSHLDYGQARASVIIPKPTQISIDLSAASSQALAMQFQGLVEAASQGAGSVNAQTLLVGTPGVWQSLGKRQIFDAGFGVTDATGSTTYEADTHYEVDWLRGEIRFLPVAGAPAAGDEVKISMQWLALKEKIILGGRIAQLRCGLRFTGKNIIDNAPLRVDVHECVLGASGGFDFLAQDFNPISLSGKIIIPAGKTEGYEIRLLDN